MVKEVDEAVRSAVKCGYRLFDSATVYKNENAIGKTLQSLFDENYVKREDIFIATPKDHGFDKTIKSVEQSLQDLNMSYIDLYIVHWPGSFGKPPNDPKHASIRKESWQALESMVDSGKVKSIGVSNYTVRHLEELLGYAKIKPVLNQFELHPCLYQKKLVEFCEKHQILIQAYSSLGRNALLTTEYEQKYPFFKDIKAKYPRPFSQILLKWAIQHGWIILPKSKSPARIQENFDLEGWELQQEDMKLLDSIGEAERFCWDPTNVA